MGIPLILWTLAGFVAANSACSDDDKPNKSEDGGTDTEGGTNACETTPKIFEGDGVYEVQTANKIIADNGVSFVIGKSELHPDTHEANFFAADFYVGETRLNLLPVMLDHRLCTTYYGLAFESISIQKTECGNPLKVGFKSVYPGPIQSRQDLYAACRQKGEVHSLCSDFIPFEPAPTETIYRDGKFQVITPNDTHPIIGEYYLNQLRLAYDSLVPFLGTSEITPVISLRWYLDDGGPIYSASYVSNQIKFSAPWPGTEAAEIEFIQKEGQGGLTTIPSNLRIILKLRDLLQQHFRLPFWLEVGLAKYAQVHVMERSAINHTPSLQGTYTFGSFITIPNHSVKLRFTQRHVETGAVFEETTRRWFSEKSSLTFDGGRVLVLVERITENDVAVRVFQEENVYSRANGWIWEAKTECFETGYTEYAGVWLDNTFYQYATIDGSPLKVQNYVRLTNYLPGDPETLFFNTAFCFYERLREFYGHEVLHKFLRDVDQLRRDSIAQGGFTLFCTTKALETAVGQDLTEYFQRFGSPTSCDYASELPPLYAEFRECR